MKVDIGNEFYHRLANRDEKQGDGKFTAIEFREKYLGYLDNNDIWKSNNIDIIIFDFSNVKIIGPSFANEAFAYFTKYAKPEKIKSVIRFEKISKIHQLIIEKELETGYSGKIKF